MSTFAPLLQAFFTERLLDQRRSEFTYHRCLSRYFPPAV